MFCFKMLLGILQRTVFSCRFKKAEINTQTLTLAKFSLSTQNVTFLAHDSYRSEMDLKIKVLLHQMLKLAQDFSITCIRD